jgi:hypothetical protein
MERHLGHGIRDILTLQKMYTQNDRRKISEKTRYICGEEGHNSIRRKNYRTGLSHWKIKKYTTRSIN